MVVEICGVEGEEGGRQDCPLQGPIVTNHSCPTHSVASVHTVVCQSDG